jgi:hypothetical protein
MTLALSAAAAAAADWISEDISKKTPVKNYKKELKTV